MEKGEIIKNDDPIYITPGIEWNKIILNIENCQNKTLIIGSRGDSLFTLYDYSRLKTNKNINIIEFEKENHVLEIGEIQNDLDVLANVITGIEKFIIENA